MKIGIILTGLVHDYCLDELIEIYKNLDKKYVKIISTWTNIEEKIILVK